MTNPEQKDTEQAARDAGIQFGLNALQQIPRGDPLAMECHLTGVLIVFWGALWGTYGAEYARGFIEAQLRGMQPGQPSEKYAAPRTH